MKQKVPKIWSANRINQEVLRLSKKYNHVEFNVKTLTIKFTGKKK